MIRGIKIENTTAACGGPILAGPATGSLTSETQQLKLSAVTGTIELPHPRSLNLRPQPVKLPHPRSLDQLKGEVQQLNSKLSTNYPIGAVELRRTKL